MISLLVLNPAIILSITTPLIITANRPYNPIFIPKVTAPNKVTKKSTINKDFPISI